MKDNPGSASLEWETFEKIKVLKVWKVEGEDKYPQIALARVPNQDFQKFVQNPKALVAFVNKHKVFSKPVNEVSHWASLMTASPGGPDKWLLTFSHSRMSYIAITSQPDDDNS